MKTDILKIYQVHVSSTDVDARARYSNSTLERDTIGCFLALQDMQLPPMNTQNLVVDRLVMGDPAESASLNPYRSRVLVDNRRMPCSMVPWT